MRRVCSMETGAGRDAVHSPQLKFLCGCPHGAPEIGGGGEMQDTPPRRVQPQQGPAGSRDSGPMGSGHEGLQPPQLLLWLWLRALESPS